MGITALTSPSLNRILMLSEKRASITSIKGSYLNISETASKPLESKNSPKVAI